MSWIIIGWLAEIDWATLIVGIILPQVVWGIKGVWVRQVHYRDFGINISGLWHCREFDPKGSIQNNPPYTVGTPRTTEVKITRGLFGKIEIKVLKPEGTGDSQTNWVAECKTRPTGSLVGTWRSVVPNTGRHGALLLKFMEGGRAVGYWLADQREIGLGYGYMVLCRDKDEADNLVKQLPSDFESLDVLEWAKVCLASQVEEATDNNHAS